MKSIYKRILRILFFTVILFGGYLFGVAFLDNAHLSYIRYLGKNTVAIYNSRGGGGTGWIATGSFGHKYIITNNHICESAEGEPLVILYKGDRYLANPLKSYPKNDLCAIPAPEAFDTAFRIARSVSFGERVYAIGHPLLEPLTVTEGELSSDVTILVGGKNNVPKEECTKETYKWIDLSDNPMAVLFGIVSVCTRELPCNSSTISILPGNSGSAVVNIWGNVVGVAFASYESGTHSYIVPLSALKDFMSTL